jgi:hypothetical protein
MSIASAFESEAMKLVVQEAHEEVTSSLKAFSVRVPESTVLIMDNLARELRCSRNDVAMMILTNGCYEAAKAVASVFATDEMKSEMYRSIVGCDITQAEVVFGAVITKGSDYFAEKDAE